jgi:hypothetical protein
MKQISSIMPDKIGGKVPVFTLILFIGLLSSRVLKPVPPAHVGYLFIRYHGFQP